VSNVIDLQEVRARRDAEVQLGWTCGCGCQHWYLRPDGVECVDCGYDKPWPELLVRMGVAGVDAPPPSG